MGFQITDECTSCGACLEECPSNAIVEVDGKYEITDDCEECGTCVEICFLEAIVET
ncbi:MAG: 4Fe-4S binding protein [Deltaproteobacteria bacterium]|nr:4Fe-4S binding protein [Deltaproteobacteria bacterium]